MRSSRTEFAITTNTSLEGIERRLVNTSWMRIFTEQPLIGYWTGMTNEEPLSIGRIVVGLLRYRRQKWWRQWNENLRETPKFPKGLRRIDLDLIESLFAILKSRSLELKPTQKKLRRNTLKSKNEERKQIVEKFVKSDCRPDRKKFWSWTMKPTAPRIQRISREGSTIIAVTKHQLAMKSDSRERQSSSKNFWYGRRWTNLGTSRILTFLQGISTPKCIWRSASRSAWCPLFEKHHQIEDVIFWPDMARFIMQKLLSIFWRALDSNSSNLKIMPQKFHKRVPIEKYWAICKAKYKARKNGAKSLSSFKRIWKKISGKWQKRVASDSWSMFGEKFDQLEGTAFMGLLRLEIETLINILDFCMLFVILLWLCDF